MAHNRCHPTLKGDSRFVSLALSVSGVRQQRMQDSLRRALIDREKSGPPRQTLSSCKVLDHYHFRVDPIKVNRNSRRFFQHSDLYGSPLIEKIGIRRIASARTSRRTVCSISAKWDHSCSVLAA